MSLITNFAIGFLAALIGVIPPGLLNMSAAKIAMKNGSKNAMLFSLGVGVTVCVQTYVALLFARYLDGHPEVVAILQQVAAGIFLCLTIYFFFIARDSRIEVPSHVKYSKSNRFFYGMFLAMINLLPLPYWVYVSITFSSFGWFSFEQADIWATVLASGLGTVAMLGVYVLLFKERQEKKLFNLNMNYIIGLITAVITVITFVKILSNI